jgi:hypothetical protein
VRQSRWLWFVMSLSIAVPRAYPQAARRRVGQEVDPNVPDVAHISLTVTRAYRGIKDLFDAADLVVEGYTVKVFPSRETNPETHFLATDALVKISRVLKGPSVSQVLIFQNGGTTGLRQRIPDQYHLVSEGGHYIFFLAKEPPTFASPQYEPRYSITGAWSGMFKINSNNAVEVSPATDADIRTRYEGKPPTLLLQAITAAQ